MAEVEVVYRITALIVAEIALWFAPLRVTRFLTYVPTIILVLTDLPLSLRLAIVLADLHGVIHLIWPFINAHGYILQDSPFYDQLCHTVMLFYAHYYMSEFGPLTDPIKWISLVFQIGCVLNTLLAWHLQPKKREEQTETWMERSMKRRPTISKTLKPDKAASQAQNYRRVLRGNSVTGRITLEREQTASSIDHDSQNHPKQGVMEETLARFNYRPLSTAPEDVPNTPYSTHASNPLLSSSSSSQTMRTPRLHLATLTTLSHQTESSSISAANPLADGTSASTTGVSIVTPHPRLGELVKEMNWRETKESEKEDDKEKETEKDSQPRAERTSISLSKPRKLSDSIRLPSQNLDHHLRSGEDGSPLILSTLSPDDRSGSSAESTPLCGAQPSSPIPLTPIVLPSIATGTSVSSSPTLSSMGHPPPLSTLSTISTTNSTASTSGANTPRTRSPLVEGFLHFPSPPKPRGEVPSLLPTLEDSQTATALGNIVPDTVIELEHVKRAQSIDPPRAESPDNLLSSSGRDEDKDIRRAEASSGNSPNRGRRRSYKERFRLLRDVLFKATSFTHAFSTGYFIFTALFVEMRPTLSTTLIALWFLVVSLYLTNWVMFRFFGPKNKEFVGKFFSSGYFEFSFTSPGYINVIFWLFYPR